MSVWLGTNQRRSVWEWLTEIPGDVIVCTIGWPGGNSQSFYEMHPDVKVTGDEYQACDIQLTHFADGQPMIPRRPIRQWYCYWLPNSTDEAIQTMKEAISASLIQQGTHASYVIDASDWNHLDPEWVRVMQQLLTKEFLFHASQQKIYLYLPHATMLKVLEEESNMGGKIHT